jgi:transcriptional regulator with XRE-family HTH domain
MNANRIGRRQKNSDFCESEFTRILTIIEKSMENSGNQIMEMRKLRGITQEHIAEMLGISQSAYSRLEKGIRRISADELRRICEVLRVDANFILGLEVADIKKDNRPQMPQMHLTIDFTEDDAQPDGALVKRLSEIIRQINGE